MFILVNTHDLLLSYIFLHKCVKSSRKKTMEVKETNQYLQDCSSDIIKVMKEWKQGSAVLTDMMRKNISCIITVGFYFFHRSLLLIELSGRVNGGCLLMMALLSAFIPCGRTCSPFMHHVLLLTLCTEIYCIIRMAEITLVLHYRKDCQWRAPFFFSK